MTSDAENAENKETHAGHRSLLRNPAIIAPVSVALIAGIFGLAQKYLDRMPSDEGGGGECETTFDFGAGPVSARLPVIMRALEHRCEGTPELQTRLEAIAALSVMSNEGPSDAFYPQAVEILTNYIKQNIDARRGPGPHVEEDRGTYRPRDVVDAVAALQMIRRASPVPVQIRLAGIDFRRINLAGLDMEGFYLAYSDFGEAFLSACKCRGADFAFAKFDGTAVWNADFRDVNFHRAELARSKWAGTDFAGSNIEEAHGHDQVALLDGPIGLLPAQLALFE